MRILISWLKDFVAFEASVQELADALTMRGFEVSAIEPPPHPTKLSDDDAILDLEITANRPDCLSIFGIAREVSTIYNTQLHFPILNDEPSKDKDSRLTVTLKDSELCPRYATLITDVKIEPSPAWLIARLEAAGIRPINNVVDATNYVMHELGHPMHAFDLDCLSGNELQIRRAAHGEKIRTIDGQERVLQEDMLVISDAKKVQAVAGVMGGSNSEVTTTTRVVVLESAYFEPTSIRRTSKRLGLSTDSSYRFERGVDIQAPIVALRRTQALLTKIKAGHSREPIIDRYPHPRKPVVIELRHQQIGRILGVEPDSKFIVNTLKRLGFEIKEGKTKVNNLSWQVRVPTHRVDVNLEIDLIEEIARYHGYDKLPSSFPNLEQPPAPTGKWVQQQRLLRRLLTASGCSEAINYGFIEKVAAVPFLLDPNNMVKISNPLSEKFAVMRPALLPGLVDALVRNRRREHNDIRLFEIGKRFSRKDGETLGLGIVMTGRAQPKHWSDSDRQTDFFDLKGVIENVFDALGITPEFKTTERPILVQGRAATVNTITTKGLDIKLGYLGQLTPTIAIARGFPEMGDEIYVAELDLEKIEQIKSTRDQFAAKSVPRYPAIVRDLAVIIAATLPASSVRDTIRAAASATLESVWEFDRYKDKGIPKGDVSLALRLTFRAKDRTLTDSEVDKTINEVVVSLKQQHNAKLR